MCSLIRRRTVFLDYLPTKYNPRKNLKNWSSAKLNMSENQKICHPQNYTCAKICASFLCGNLEISSL